jgi:anti-sigma regulatory factor (Ser/Thr protein kinase)
MYFMHSVVTEARSLLTLTLPRDRTAAAAARRALADLDLPCTDETRLAVALLATELINNAVLHGCGTDVRLDVAQDRERLRVEVCDDGNGFDPAQRTEREDPGGWGLAIVENLSSDWGMYEGSTHVWFELDL